MTDQDLWQSVLNDIQVQISRANFITWFKNTYISKREDGCVSVAVPNRFTREWLQSKYTKTILKSLRNTSSDIKNVQYVVENKKPSLQKTTLSETITAPTPPTVTGVEQQLSLENLQQVNRSTNLNPRYSFDSFIVGPSNEMAHAAALSVVRQPGMLYNPLFIYGGVGLGKTHILQSIGNNLAEQKNVIYLTSERFTNDFISSIQNKSLESFKNKYRNKDVLIIDDVQFFAGKEQTQEEFFHTFNALYSKNKQIILSSDKPPRSIPSLEERLVSRFEGGMMVDVQNPDYETRLAIIKEKARVNEIDLQESILEYIANNIYNNIRELEGALNLVSASAKQLYNNEITEEQVKTTLSHIIRRPSKGVSYKHILKSVSRFYDVKEEDIIKRNRRQEFVVPRQVAMYFMRSDLNLSYPYIGSRLGKRDHTTVIHACDKITKKIESDPMFEDQINLIKESIYNEV